MTTLVFKYIYKLIPDAYHGTSLEAANKILEEKKFIPGRGEDLFLGDGSYFYEGNLDRAKTWAQKRNEGRAIGVLQVSIELGIFLDLNNPDHQRKLAASRTELERKEGKQLNPTWVINAVARIYKVDTIRATIRRRMHIMLSDFPVDMSEIIVCLRNPERISNIEMVYRGVFRR